jgi:hypothetical protein
MVKILKAGGQAADEVSCEAIIPASSLSGLRTESDPLRTESQIGLCVGVEIQWFCSHSEKTTRIGNALI